MPRAEVAPVPQLVDDQLGSLGGVGLDGAGRGAVDQGTGERDDPLEGVVAVGGREHPGPGSPRPHPRRLHVGLDPARRCTSTAGRRRRRTQMVAASGARRRAATEPSTDSTDGPRSPSTLASGAVEPAHGARADRRAHAG